MADRPGRPVSPKVVAFGGGHGMYACLSALRRLTDHLTAIVEGRENNVTPFKRAEG